MPKLFFTILLLLYGHLLIAIEQQELLKKIVLINEQGRRTVVNVETIISIKHVQVNSTKNWLTSVIELNCNSEKTITNYKCSAAYIVEEAEKIGVRFTKLHDGQYYNPKYNSEVLGLETQSSIYLKNKSNAKGLKSNDFSQNSRTGKILITEEVHLNVSKRVLPKIKKGFLNSGFRKIGTKGLGVLGGIFIAAAEASAAEEKLEYYQKSSLENFGVQNELISEYQKIQYLEGEIPANPFAILHLANDLVRGETCNNFAITKLENRLMDTIDIQNNISELEFDDFCTTHLRNLNSAYHPELGELTSLKFSILLRLNETRNHYAMEDEEDEKEDIKDFGWLFLVLLIISGAIALDIHWIKSRP